MRYFTGIDVSLRSVSICVVDEAGEVRHEAKVAAEVDVIVSTLKRFSSEIRQVGFEAGTLTQYLTYGLSAAGYDVICMEARQVAASLAAMRNKTDRNDARGLAQILRTGWFRTVHVKSVESHQVRALLASRKMILTKCIDIENEVRGLLKVFGVRLPARVGHGGFDELVRPRVVALPDVAKCLLPLLDARRMLYRTYRQLDTAVRGLARQDPVCRRLMTVPGVGPVTSLTFKAAVDEPHRFRSSRNVAAHFGLTPRRYQSGETDNPGRISKAGDPGVRLALYFNEFFDSYVDFTGVPLEDGALTLLTIEGHLMDDGSGISGAGPLAFVLFQSRASVVPEPGSFVLIVLALVGLTFARTRRPRSRALAADTGF